MRVWQLSYRTNMQCIVNIVISNYRKQIHMSDTYDTCILRLITSCITYMYKLIQYIHKYIQ